MPLSKQNLLSRFVDGLRASGGSAIVTTAGHPFDLVARVGSRELPARLYIWNVTHGGGAARAPEEYRIQVTGVAGEIDGPPGGQALIMGWDAEDEVFAAFDPRRHRRPSPESPSIQISRPTLRQGRSLGVASQVRANGETALAVSPEFLGAYLLGQGQFHDVGGDPDLLRDLILAGRNPSTSPESSPDPPPTERATRFREVTELVRAADFRVRVLGAYGYRCVVCDLALGLVEAAHIVPVGGDAGGSDETSNGLALCSLHHDAYDRGLLTIAADGSIGVDEEQIEAFREEGIDSGEQEFRSTLRAAIRPPGDMSEAPTRETLQRGGDLRRT